MTFEALQGYPSPGMSPQISFSYNVSSNDTVPMGQYIRLSPTHSSSIDFNFGFFHKSFGQECSSADILFLNGKILPIDIKKRTSPPPLIKPPVILQAHDNPIKLQRKKPEEFCDQELNHNPKKPSSSVSCFKRSLSLNCGSGCARTFLCPLPLNSTGSTATTVKRLSLGSNNINQKRQLLKSMSCPNSSLKVSNGSIRSRL